MYLTKCINNGKYLSASVTVKNKINAVDMLINRSEDVMAIASKLLINICLRSYALQAEGLSVLHVCIFSAFRII